jgi:O-succinylbenzoic acid--CoA ligase
MAFQLIFHNCSVYYEQKVRNFVMEFCSEQTTFAVQTSGSTGPPKEIIHSKENLIASASRSNSFFNLTSDSRVWLSLSLDAIGGKMILVRAIVGDYEVHVCEPTRNPFLLFPKDFQVDFISLVPYQLERICSETPHLISRTKCILLGGSPLNHQSENKLLQLDTTIYMGYGMTETISHVAIRKIGSPSYQTLNGVTLETISGQSYLSDSVLSIHKMALTDQLELQDSEHFKWIGRTDFAILSGGIKIHPELLEAELSTYIDEPFIVAGLPDKELGEKCVVIIESTLRNYLIDKIKEISLDSFGKYAVPKAIYYHSMIRTASEKINRKATVQQLISLQA